MGKLIRFRKPPKQKPAKRRQQRQQFGFSPLAAALALGGLVVLGYFSLGPGQIESVSGASFTLCDRPPHFHCVIDGDTFYFESQSIRIADIDTPETNPPRCTYEEELGERATHRLLELLNAGPFELKRLGSRDEDRYGRRLRIVVRNGRSLGDILVSEGLARTWTGRRLPWCS